MPKENAYAQDFVSVFPPHLVESSLVTNSEMMLRQRWIETLKKSVYHSDKESRKEEWLENWLPTALPFSFIYDQQKSSNILPNWQISEDVEGREGWSLTWTNPKSRLVVTWQVKDFNDYPATEWILCFRNEGDSETPLIKNVQALDLCLNHASPSEPYIIHGANGGRSLPDDFMPFSQRLPSPDPLRRNEMHLGAHYPSSNRHLPFFNIETPEDHGAIVGIGWSGAWVAKMKTNGTQLNTKVGLNESHFVLRPREEVRTPRILLVFWEGKRLHGHNMLRQILYKHYVPRLQGKPQKPLISFNTAFAHDYMHEGGLLHQATEERVLPFVKPFIDLGIELFIIDAGWYRTEGDETWREWPGDWRYDRRKFPRGFRVISKILRSKSVPFGIWFAPELVSKKVPLFREHPEWLRDDPIRKILRMEMPEAREWFLKQVNDLVVNEAMGCYRQDMSKKNAEYDPEPDYRKGISEIAHNTGLYALWDTIIQRYPNLIMEGCCSGGRRIDLETLSRFHWHQKSDRWYDSESDQCGLYGANLFLPGGIINVPTESVDDYGAWSSFSGQLCLGWNVLGECFPKDLAHRQIKMYKRIRHLLSGDFFPLTPCSLAEPWIGFQFHRVDLNEGFALVFLRRKPEKAVYPINRRFNLRLRGLDPEAHYEVHYEKVECDETLSGSALSKGVNININDIPGVEMIIYKPLN